MFQFFDLINFQSCQMTTSRSILLLEISKLKRETFKLHCTALYIKATKYKPFLN